MAGTGCKIITAVAEKCDPAEVQNIRFIGFDTNVNDLQEVSKSGARIYRVQTSNPQTVGNYLNHDEDALKNWFPKSAVMYDKTVSEGAGQVRAISRLAFNDTIKTGRIQTLYDAIDDLFRKTGNEFQQAMRIVFATTASGGTGSGMLLPISMFVRDYVKNKYPKTGVIVRALILLPETLDSAITSATERESQRRNAYATIKELNAFMIKGSGFMDTDDDLKRYSDLHLDITIPASDELKRLDLLPCDFCFLMDGQNAEDHTLTKLDQYIQQAAQALYAQNIGPMQKDAFSVEDNIIKELSNPGNHGRNRFGGIGASVLKYNYESTSNYVAYQWALDCICGEGDAAKWLKYDNTYELKLQEAKSKGSAISSIPTRGEVYIEALLSDPGPFGKSLRDQYLGGDTASTEDPQVEHFMEVLEENINNALLRNSDVLEAMDLARKTSKAPIQFSEENNGISCLESLRQMEKAIKSNAAAVGRAVAEANLLRETKTSLEEDPGTLEKLLKNAYGEVFHPSAARFRLYLLQSQIQKGCEAAEAAERKCIKTLDKFSPSAQNQAFNARSTKDTDEESIDELCQAEADASRKNQISEIQSKLNALLPEYYRAIEKYGKAASKHAAYEMANSILADINAEFERFYNSFRNKVEALMRKKDEVVDALAFNRGDSTYHVCASREMLDEICRSVKSQSTQNTTLDSDTNALILMR